MKKLRSSQSYKNQLDRAFKRRIQIPEQDRDEAFERNQQRDKARRIAHQPLSTEALIECVIDMKRRLRAGPTPRRTKQRRKEENETPAEYEYRCSQFWRDARAFLAAAETELYRRTGQRIEEMVDHKWKLQDA